MIKELPATALLRPLGRDTLAILTWEATKDARFDVAALPALLIVAVGLVPVVILVRLRDRAGPGAGPARRARSRPSGSPRGTPPRRSPTRRRGAAPKMFSTESIAVYIEWSWLL